MTKFVAVFTLIAALAGNAAAKQSLPLDIYYKKNATYVESKEGKFKAKIQFRTQFRYSFSNEADPRTPNQFDQGNISTMRIRRGRLKTSGHAYDPRLYYNFEYDWPTSNLLNTFVSLNLHESFRIQAGQWKVMLGRERIDSSGKQTFVDRSIVNREFTLDRQQGVTLYGRLFKETPADLSYWAGVFSGAGINSVNDDDNMLWLGKLQWNVFGGEMKYTQSDLKKREKPALNVGFGGSANQTNATRFSGSGGGNLDGFAAGSAGQYDIKQFVQDTLFKWKGFSLQSEYHWKRVHNNIGAVNTFMNGGYVQAGYFPNGLIASIPENLECAVRFAYVDPNHAVNEDIRQEYTAAVNWFFAGHANKITADFTHFSLNQTGAPMRTEQRARLQWDISF